MVILSIEWLITRIENMSFQHTGNRFLSFLIISHYNYIHNGAALGKQWTFVPSCFFFLIFNRNISNLEADVWSKRGATDAGGATHPCVGMPRMWVCSGTRSSHVDSRINWGVEMLKHALCWDAWWSISCLPKFQCLFWVALSREHVWISSCLLLLGLVVFRQKF